LESIEVTISKLNDKQMTDAEKNKVWQEIKTEKTKNSQRISNKNAQMEE
jgi:predicted Fe-S protein YdhL (DUF1289 family)